MNGVNSQQKQIQWDLNTVNVMPSRKFELGSSKLAAVWLFRHRD